MYKCTKRSTPALTHGAYSLTHTRHVTENDYDNDTHYRECGEEGRGNMEILTGRKLPAGESSIVVFSRVFPCVSLCVNPCACLIVYLHRNCKKLLVRN